MTVPVEFLLVGHGDLGVTAMGSTYPTTSLRFVSSSKSSHVTSVTNTVPSGLTETISSEVTWNSILEILSTYRASRATEGHVYSAFFELFFLSNTESQAVQPAPPWVTRRARPPLPDAASRTAGFLVDLFPEIGDLTDDEIYSALRDRRELEDNTE